VHLEDAGIILGSLWIDSAGADFEMDGSLFLEGHENMQQRQRVFAARQPHLHTPTTGFTPSPYNACMLAYTCASMRINIHTHTHTHTHPCPFTYTYTSMHINIQTLSRTQIHVYMHLHANIANDRREPCRNSRAKS